MRPARDDAAVSVSIPAISGSFVSRLGSAWAEGISRKLTQ
jgi:hypothetical protein